jgi:uncharacterized protein YndB with AHSA1/START domain
LLRQPRVPQILLEADGFVAAPPDVVWSQLVDRESVAAWVDDIEPLSGAGERFATRRSSAPCSPTIEGRVTHLERERRLALVLHGPWRLLREIALEIDLSPDEGGTRVRLRAIHSLRWAGLLLRPLLRLRAQIALHRASRGFRAAIDDEMARRRRALARPRDRHAGAARRRSAAELLLRSIPG